METKTILDSREEVCTVYAVVDHRDSWNPHEVSLHASRETAETYRDLFRTRHECMDFDVKERTLFE